MHTRVLRSEKGCRIRVTHVHACSDCVHTRDDAVKLNYASRFVRVIYSSHIVSIKLGTVTPSVVVDWQYTNDRTVQLHRGYPHSSRCRFLAVLPAIVQTVLPGGATHTRSDAAICASPSGTARVSLGTATPLSAKFFETMLSSPAWILFWRCNPHAPPFSMQLWQCPPHVPRRCLARVQRCLAGKRFSPAFGTASCRFVDGVSHASWRCLAGKRLQALLVGPLWHCCARSVRQSLRLHRHPGV